MPPRQRIRDGAAASAAAPPALGILDLPNDLLARCLAPLKQQERFKCAALVCKRFREASLAPSLVHSAVVTHRSDRSDITQQPGQPAGVPLQPPAAHLRCLQLGEDGRQLCHFPDFHKGDKAFAMALLGACLSACAGLAFEELHVFTIIQQPSLGFLASFTSLRRLRIEVPNDVELQNGITGLTALRELGVEPGAVRIHAPHLPPAISRLYIGDSTSTQLPPQLTSLSALVELELNCVSLAEDSLAPFASLPSLRNLRLHDHALPASLARLTQLKVLSVARMFSDWAAPLWAVLPALQQLTTLSLKFGWLDRSQPLVPSLASLPRLERLCFTVEGFHDMFTLPLSAGPWVSSLRVLAAPFCILRPSIELLRGAGKLEHLTNIGPPMPDGMPDGPCPGWRAFFDFWPHTRRCAASVLRPIQASSSGASL